MRVRMFDSMTIWQQVGFEKHSDSISSFRWLMLMLMLQKVMRSPEDDNRLYFVV